MKSNKIAFLMTAILAISSLAGCGSSSPATGTTAASTTAGNAATTGATTATGTSSAAKPAATTGAGTSKGKTTIELFHEKPENVELYKKLTDEFMKENPDIQVNVTLSESTTTTLISRIAAGNIPELISVFPWNASYQDMMKEGIFKDLTNESFMQMVNPDVVKRGAFNGKQYALPLSMNTYGLYYNVDIFKKVGVTVPKTMDEMWAVCDKLVAAGYQPFSFPDKKAIRINQMFDRMLIGCVDHDFFTKCNDLIAGKYKVTEDPNMRKYAETILKLRTYANKDSLGYDDEPAYEEFTSGKSAMYIDGSWAVTTFQTMNPNLNFTCTAIPTISTDEFWTAGTVDTAYAISSKCSDAQYAACKKFLDFLVSDKVAQEFADGDKNPTTIKNVTYNVEPLKEVNDDISNGHFGPILSGIWTQDLKNGVVPIVQALIMNKDVDTFLNDFQNLLQEYYTPRDN